MAIATIKFDLSNPDDVAEFKRYNQLGNVSSFMFQLLHNEWKRLRIRVEGTDMDPVETVNFTFERIYKLLEESKVNLEEI